MPAGATTQLSTKGQVVLPKAVRERRGWRAGDKLVVEERPEGVLIRKAADEAYPVDSGSSICGSGVAKSRPALFLGLSRLMRSQ